MRYRFIMGVKWAINIILLFISQGGIDMGELIAVLSGKGGTGKTSVCAGLATALAQEGLQVLCIDCDVGLRNLDIALGMSDMASLSFADVYSGNYSLDQAQAHPIYGSLKFLTAPMNCPADEVDRDAFESMLAQARSRFQYVFLDAPAGIEAGFSLAACYADRILLVTGADPAAVRDAARAAEVLELMGKKNVRLIVNRVQEKMFSVLKLTVDDIMDQSGVPLIGLVPEDDSVVLAAAFKKPLLKQTKKGASAACRRIAKRLQGMSEPIAL